MVRNIKTFNLQIYAGKGPKKAATWMQETMRNGVKEFHTYFSHGNMGRYPCKQTPKGQKKFEIEEKLIR